MFKWTAFPFIRIALCLIVGIVAQQTTAVWWDNWWVTLSCFMFFMVLVKWIFANSILNGFCAFITLIYTGGVVAEITEEVDQQNHYTQYSHAKGFVGQVVSDNTDRDRYQRYEVELAHVYKDTNYLEVQGKIYLYVQKDSASQLFGYGDVVMVRKGYFPVAAPKNPHEFNYKRYLARQNIYAHAFVTTKDVQFIYHKSPNWVMSAAFEIRTKLKNQIVDYIDAPRERAILTALLIGVKDYLDDETKLAYSSAGAMHVLAVSGLHVGIVYLLLSLLFKKLKERPIGNLLFVIISILTIWMYALITGFSPSVMRAVTMFTVIIISSGFKLRANIYNSLGIAATVLILIDPNIIYAVGFQLSFAAVFGIVLIHPRIYRLLDFNHPVPDYLWSITCVSIAAQLATFPLTMLYFHQFPTYFLFSNLVVIPSAVVMLVGGFAMSLIGAVFPEVGAFIGWILGRFVWLINEMILSLQHLPHPIFDWLYFDKWDTLLVNAMLLFGILAIVKYSFQYLAIALTSVMILMGWFYVKDYHQQAQQRVIFYEIDEVTAIDLIKGKEAILLVDDYGKDKREVIGFQVDPNRLVNGLPKTTDSWQPFDSSLLVYHHELFDLIIWEGLQLAILRGGDEKWKNSIAADVVYFKTPEDFTTKINTSEVILGTGFGYYDVLKFREELEKLKINVHSLTYEGYWQYDFNESNALAFRTEIK